MKRRDLLQAGVALPALAAADSVFDAEAKDTNKNKNKNNGNNANAERKNKKKGKNKGGAGRSFAGMNVVMFITDQERAIMHFPNDWARENLPGATRLEENGLTFNRAFCSSCMCSPSRATLFTGYFPAQHGVKYTLEENNDDADLQVPLPLPNDLPNLATVMKAAGYSVPYKGKFHLSKKSQGGSDPKWVPEDVEKYEWERWNPPDAGANQDIDQFGGGDPDNDGRYMDNLTPPPAGYDTYESVLEFLKSPDAKEQPFFLIVSLVNPHDVLSYPSIYDQPGAGYDDSDLVGDVGLPDTVHEELLPTKPTAQAEFLAISALIGPLPTDEMKTNYLNFYGNLIKESDAYLVDILNTLEEEGLTDDTLVIKTSDHGEMGMAHGGMRQKMFNFYEETLRVPLVFSNPKRFPKKHVTNAMVSHVDFLPTMASLLGVPQEAREDWQGRDYSKVVRKPKKKKGPQKYVVFTYDDIQAGQVPPAPMVPPPNHITSIREGRYKLAKYYDADGVEPEQWEMYDLKHDKNETNNLAYPGNTISKNHKKELNRLKNKLATVEETRLQPL
jgi:choline-sulfatase